MIAVVVERLADELQHLDELAEDQHAVAAGRRPRCTISRSALSLPLVVARTRPRRLEQARVAGHLTQARERREDLDLAFATPCFSTSLMHLVAHLRAGSACRACCCSSAIGTTISCSIFSGRSCATSALVRRRMNGWMVARSAARSRCRRARSAARSALRTSSSVAEQARRHEVEDRPDLAQAVLDRRAGQREAALALEPLGRARGRARAGS